MQGIVTIKPYSSQYQAGVLDLILPIQQQEYNIPITREEQPDLLQIEQFYQQNKGNFWVATVGETVVGSIALLDIQQEQAALRKMFVAKDFRGSTYGTARQLLDNALAWAREHAIMEIYLGTTVQFTTAHRFYEKHNFKSISPEQLPERFPRMQVDTVFYKRLTAH
ncbi:GNAT family N-acetyltransferase [Paenibacillus sp. sgz500958]|uniref:GNAT family N-acetyltransferase n=1 Tax=Paenibacillus sp. sgz500958 TaxID=3242475 RepID=UPI0036D3A219